MSKNNGRVVLKGAEANELVERALRAGWVLKLKRHSWGNRKKLAQEVVEEKFQDDADVMRAVQKLLDCPELRSVYQCIGYINGRIDALSQPWLGEGVYWFIEERVPIMQEELEKTAAEIAKRMDVFLSVYDERKAEYKAKHPKYYKDSHYPSAARMKEKFGLEWNWQRIRPALGSEDVGVVSKEVVDRETAKYRDAVKTGIEVVVAAARKSTLEVLEHLRDCLKKGDKKFQDTTVEKPKKYLEELGKTLSFLDDAALQKVISDSRDILNGVYGEDLRADDGYREAMAGVMDTVVSEFRALPMVELERDIEL